MSAPVFRLYRIVASDTFQLPELEMKPSERTAYTRTAEAELHARLLAGEAPLPMLVAPERATPALLGADSEVSNVYGFLMGTGMHPLAAAYLDRPSVLGMLEADAYVPDPVAPDEFIAAGSVVVTSGKLVGLMVTPWLAPIADFLTETYGVPVTLMESDDPVRSAPPIVLPRALPQTTCESLIEYMDSTPTSASPTHPNRQWCTAPLELFDVNALLARIAPLYGLPMDRTVVVLSRYDVGADHPWHTDAYEGDPGSLNRTVAFSIPLNDAYQGGAMELEHVGELDLRPGDAVVFTARTWHAVQPITSGSRYVLLGFSERAA